MASLVFASLPAIKFCVCMCVCAFVCMCLHFALDCACLDTHTHALAHASSNRLRVSTAGLAAYSRSSSYTVNRGPSPAAEMPGHGLAPKTQALRAVP